VKQTRRVGLGSAVGCRVFSLSYGRE